MINKTIKNKKVSNKILKISIILLAIISITFTIYRIYYNKTTIKNEFRNINKQNKLCNLELTKVPYNIYKNYYFATLDNENYIIFKASKKEYKKIFKYSFEDKYTLKGMSKLLDNDTKKHIEEISNGEIKGNVLYLDTYTITLLDKAIILSIILIIISIIIILINNVYLKSINISQKELDKIDKEKFIKYDKLYISDNYIYIKNILEIIKIKDIILIYQKDNYIYIITKYNNEYKFKYNEEQDIFDIITNKNKDIIIGINETIKKEIKKKYNITLKEV